MDAREAEIEIVRVAIVGGGISGLSAGWLLTHFNEQQPSGRRTRRYEVTLFEKCPTIGMDANSFDYDPNSLGIGDRNKEETDGDGVELDSHSHLNRNSLRQQVYQVSRIDVPLRVFSVTYYPNLTQLYQYIGVTIVPANYEGSFTFWKDSNHNKMKINRTDTYFQYYNYLWKELSLSYIRFGWNLLDFKFLRILYDTGRFFYKAPRDLKRHKKDHFLKGKTIYEYVTERHYSTAFIEEFLLVVCAAMCTCSYNGMRNYPADIVIQYLVTRSGYGVRRVQDSVKAVTDRLSSKFTDIHCGAEIESVKPDKQKQQVIIQHKNGKTELFDHVILATEAFSALKLLKEPTKEQVESLSSFSYETSNVVMHTDTSLMPRDKSGWASVNLFASKDHDKPMATIWMNRVQDSLKGVPQDVFQTWNPLTNPREELKITESQFNRPLIDHKAVRGMEILDQIQGQDHIWYVGSYSLYGMPLLENGVRSGLVVAEALDGTLKRPWNAKDSLVMGRSWLSSALLSVILCALAIAIALLSWFLRW